MRAYLQVLRAPGVLGITVSQLFARLPLGMLSFAILLHVKAQTDSFALAGGVVACLGVGQAAAVPATARLIGLLGIGATLSTTALLNAASMLVLAYADLSMKLLLGVGLLVGASVPPITPAIRAFYPQLATGDSVRALFALDTTVQEVIFVAGPVATTSLAAVSTAAALTVSAAVTVLGTTWFLLRVRHLGLRMKPSSRRFGTVLANRQVVLAMASSAFLVGSVMALEVGALALFGGNPISAGVAIAAASLGSLLGGLTFGHRRIGLMGMVISPLVVAAGTVLFALTADYKLQLAAFSYLASDLHLRWLP